MVASTATPDPSSAHAAPPPNRWSGFGREGKSPVPHRWPRYTPTTRAMDMDQTSRTCSGMELRVHNWSTSRAPYTTTGIHITSRLKANRKPVTKQIAAHVAVRYQGGQRPRLWVSGHGVETIQRPERQCNDGERDDGHENAVDHIHFITRSPRLRIPEQCIDDRWDLANGDGQR